MIYLFLYIQWLFNKKPVLCRHSQNHRIIYKWKHTVRISCSPYFSSFSVILSFNILISMIYFCTFHVLPETSEQHPVIYTSYMCFTDAVAWAELFRNTQGNKGLYQPWMSTTTLVSIPSPLISIDLQLKYHKINYQH